MSVRIIHGDKITTLDTTFDYVMEQFIDADVEGKENVLLIAERTLVVIPLSKGVFCEEIDSDEDPY